MACQEQLRTVDQSCCSVRCSPGPHRVGESARMPTGWLSLQAGLSHRRVCLAYVVAGVDRGDAVLAKR